MNHVFIDSLEVYSMNMGDLTGKNFNSDEVDVVFQNGQGFRFSFGFQLEFEFLPGLPRGNNICSYKVRERIE